MGDAVGCQAATTAEEAVAAGSDTRKRGSAAQRATLPGSSGEGEGGSRDVAASRAKRGRLTATRALGPGGAGLPPAWRLRAGGGQRPAQCPSREPTPTPGPSGSELLPLGDGWPSSSRAQDTGGRTWWVRQTAPLGSPGTLGTASDGDPGPLSLCAVTFDRHFSY